MKKLNQHGGLLLAAIATMFLFSAPAYAKENFDRLATGGTGGWLNVTRPLTTDDMTGRLVLLDFWTYGCINCQQVVPDLEYLEHKFGSQILIIGVHSAKFQGEQGSDRILAAAQRFGLKHPVINDSDFSIWKSFGVRAWPTMVLLGPDGQELARYSGEGNREEIESDIQKNLDKVRKKSAEDFIKSDEAGGALSFPARVKAMADGRLVIADSGHNRFLVVNPGTGHPGTGQIEKIIGSGQRGFQDGAGTSAQFNNPRGMAINGNRMIVADTGNHALRAVDLTNGTVETLVGNGKRGFAWTVLGKLSGATPVASPWDVDVLSRADGQYVVALAGTHQLGLYDDKQRKLSILAGSGREDIDDGSAATASLAQPSGVSVDADGSIYFVDAETSSLRQLKNGKVSTLIGTGLFDFGNKDGSYPDAMMQHPQGLFSVGDEIYIADTYNNAIRVYKKSTGKLTTLSLGTATLNEPGSIWVSGGSAYIANTNGHQIDMVDLKKGSVNPLTLTK